MLTLWNKTLKLHFRNFIKTHKILITFRSSYHDIRIIKFERNVAGSRRGRNKKVTENCSEKPTRISRYRYWRR